MPTNWNHRMPRTARLTRAIRTRLARLDMVGKPTGGRMATGELLRSTLWCNQPARSCNSTVGAGLGRTIAAISTLPRLLNCKHSPEVPWRPRWFGTETLYCGGWRAHHRSRRTSGEVHAQIIGVTKPDWWEEPDLAVAVAEVEEFVASAGWDAPPQLFALVNTADLLAAQPSLSSSLGAEAAVYTPIAQEALPAGALTDDPAVAAEQAARHPDRAEARLVAGVLRDGHGGACLMRLRGEHDDAPLRGGDLAPNLLAALRLTFE